MHYIYLNTYPNGYLYVGSHSWDGEGLDPNYHGSSFVAKRFGWIPIKEQILEEVTDLRKLVAERYWIEKYAEEYGIADCALTLFKHARTWISKFKNHGRLLNCHANDASNACEAARSNESRKRQVAATDYVARTNKTDYKARKIDYKAFQESRQKHLNHKKLQQIRCDKARKVSIEYNGEIIYQGNVTGAKIMFGDAIKHPFQKAFQSGEYNSVCGKYKGFKFKVLCETSWQ